MTKPKIRIIDTTFAHSGLGSFGAGDLQIPPTYFDWHRGDKIGDIVVLTEESAHLVGQQQEKIKILLVIEPPCINPVIYMNLCTPDFVEKFDYILTHDSELVKTNSKFVQYNFGGCWIYPEQRQLYDKTKNISIISSSKRQSDGHRLRHEVIDIFSERYSIDVFGRGYTAVENKLTALKDYKYSIVIENEMRKGWNTEKLMDCLQTGTIPIYYGDPNISKLLNIDGIFTFSTIEELRLILINLELDTEPDGLKKTRDKFAAENFELSKKFCMPEDLIWNTFLKDVYESTNR